MLVMSLSTTRLVLRGSLLASTELSPSPPWESSIAPQTHPTHESISSVGFVGC
jgi:hypothetical protein